MNRLWSPWRSAYIESFKEDNRKGSGCIFCDYPAESNDSDNLILYRGKGSFVIMNLYPYNSGHLMVVPYQHTTGLDDLKPEIASEVISLLAVCRKVLSETMNAQGFNIGVNLGKAAGAGIDDHIHFHIVPRWSGDTNFMPVFADIKVIPEEMTKTYQKLKSRFDSL